MQLNNDIHKQLIQNFNFSHLVSVINIRFKNERVKMMAKDFIEKHKATFDAFTGVDPASHRAFFLVKKRCDEHRTDFLLLHYSGENPNKKLRKK